MPRDDRYRYMALVCFNVCCSDSVGVCGNVCCVVNVVKDRRFLSPGMLYVCVRDVMDVVFSVCIARRGIVGAHVGEV